MQVKLVRKYNKTREEGRITKQNDEDVFCLSIVSCRVPAH